VYGDLEYSIFLLNITKKELNKKELKDSKESKQLYSHIYVYTVIGIIKKTIDN